MKANTEVKKALTDLYKTTIQPAERAKKLRTPPEKVGPTSAMGCASFMC